MHMITYWYICSHTYKHSAQIPAALTKPKGRVWIRVARCVSLNQEPSSHSSQMELARTTTEAIELPEPLRSFQKN